jgi:hypothetical protein
LGISGFSTVHPHHIGLKQCSKCVSPAESRARVILISNLAHNWKFASASVALVLDGFGFRVLTRAVPSLEYSGPVQNADPSHIGGAFPSPQPLYYVRIGLEAVLAGVALLLLVHIFTMLEKQVSILNRFFMPASASENKETAHTND